MNSTLALPITILVSTLSVLPLPSLAGVEQGVPVKPQTTTTPQPDTLLALVEGERLTEADFSPQIHQKLRSLEDEKSRALAQELDLTINARVMKREARERGLGLMQLIDQEIIAQIPDPSEEEILQAYRMTPQFKSVPMEDARGVIVESLRQRQENIRTDDLGRNLRKKWPVILDDAPLQPSTTEENLDRIIATVADEPITLRDIETPLCILFHRIDEELYTLRAQQTEMLINDRLLQLRAEDENTTPDTVLKKAMQRLLITATADDALEYYNKNRSRITEDYQSIESEILYYLSQLHMAEAQQTFAAELREDASITLLLEQPGEPIYTFDHTDQPSRGSVDAPVTLVMFADFDCSRCAEVHEIIDQLAEEFGGDALRIVARDRPLRQHPEAFRAAEAAEVARSMGAYWEYADYLFLKPQGLSENALLTYAEWSGLDKDVFQKELQRGVHRDAVLADLELSARYDLQSTPVVFINGRLMPEKTYPALRTAIESEMKILAQSTENKDDLPDCCKPPKEPNTEDIVQAKGTSDLIIPNTPLLNQFGDPLNFYTDLIEDHTVAINFIFTTCKTICPPMTANFSQVQSILGDRVGKDIRMISVSVDPTTDRPERLKKFADLFGAEPGWSFLTGEKQRVDNLLTRLGSFSEDKNDHTPIVLIYNDKTSEWTRVYGLADPKIIAGEIRKLASPSEKDRDDAEAAVIDDQAPQDIAANFFPNTALTAQNGESLHFFDDLLKDHTVVINVMFTSCTGICPPMMSNIKEIYEKLGELPGKSVRFLSITVDPETDTVDTMREYAQSYEAGPGWYFLTGSRTNIDEVLSRIGCKTTDKYDHSTFLIIGNSKTGTWNKIFAMKDAAIIADEVRSIALGED